jgi:hypothetical protein
MDDKNNYYSRDETFVAIRVPQVDGNPALKRAILGGRVSQKDAVKAERESLRCLRAFDRGEAELPEVLEALSAYENVTMPKRSYIDDYRRTLEASPWKECACSICREHSIEVVIFRGTERNKRRGFHNLAVFGESVRRLRIPKRKAAASNVS